MRYYVYILFSQRNGTLYTGFMNDLIRRIYEHKNKQIDGFSKEHRIDKLGYYEIYDDVNEAIKREKQIKRWNRAKKLFLLERNNLDWADLYDGLLALLGFPLVIPTEL